MRLCPCLCLASEATSRFQLREVCAVSVPCDRSKGSEERDLRKNPSQERERAKGLRPRLPQQSAAPGKRIRNRKVRSSRDDLKSTSGMAEGGERGRVFV